MSSIIRTFGYLLITDLIILKKRFISRVIDFTIQLGLMTIIMSYIMPSFGLTSSYGIFQFASTACLVGLFEIYPDVALLLLDSEGDRYINYQLTLPIPSWMIWIKNFCFVTIKSILFTSFIYPICFTLVLPKINLNYITWHQVIIALIMSSILTASTTMILYTRIKNMHSLGRLWNRYLLPFWFLGCYQFSWKIMNILMEPVSYILLLNPLTYVMESNRSAIIGAQQFLPFWWCIGTIACTSIVIVYLAIKSLRRRFDHP